MKRLLTVVLLSAVCEAAEASGFRHWDLAPGSFYTNTMALDAWYAMAERYDAQEWTDTGVTPTPLSETTTYKVGTNSHVSVVRTNDEQFIAWVGSGTTNIPYLTGGQLYDIQYWLEWAANFADAGPLNPPLQSHWVAYWQTNAAGTFDDWFSDATRTNFPILTQSNVFERCGIGYVTNSGSGTVCVWTWGPTTTTLYTLGFCAAQSTNQADATWPNVWAYGFPEYSGYTVNGLYRWDSVNSNWYRDVWCDPDRSDSILYVDSGVWYIGDDDEKVWNSPGASPNPWYDGGTLEPGATTVDIGYGDWCSWWYSDVSPWGIYKAMYRGAGPELVVRGPSSSFSYTVHLVGVVITNFGQQATMVTNADITVTSTNPVALAHDWVYLYGIAITELATNVGDVAEVRYSEPFTLYSSPNVAGPIPVNTTFTEIYQVANELRWTCGKQGVAEEGTVVGLTNAGPCWGEWRYEGYGWGEVALVSPTLDEDAVWPYAWASSAKAPDMTPGANTILGDFAGDWSGNSPKLTPDSPERAGWKYRTVYAVTLELWYTNTHATDSVTEDYRASTADDYVDGSITLASGETGYRSTALIATQIVEDAGEDTGVSYDDKTDDGDGWIHATGMVSVTETEVVPQIVCQRGSGAISNGWASTSYTSARDWYALGTALQDRGQPTISTYPVTWTTETPVGNLNPTQWVFMGQTYTARTSWCEWTNGCISSNVIPFSGTADITNIGWRIEYDDEGDGPTVGDEHGSATLFRYDVDGGFQYITNR